MAEFSYATERKIRKIKEALGEGWANQIAGRSIDSVYNEIVGDTRKNLFCKVDAGIKGHLDEMAGEHKTQMAEFIEQLIEAEWIRYQTRRSETERNMLAEFTGAS